MPSELAGSTWEARPRVSRTSTVCCASTYARARPSAPTAGSAIPTVGFSAGCTHAAATAAGDIPGISAMTREPCSATTVPEGNAISSILRRARSTASAGRATTTVYERSGLSPARRN